MIEIKRDITEALLKNIAERFEFHAKNIYGNPASENSSPLYAHLAHEASKDPEILKLVANADFATQVSNLLFGAVQYLLLSGFQHPLTDYYPNMRENPLPITEAYPAFHDFCLQHTEAIEKLVTSRRVQTNEVGRCSGLLPAFNLVFERGEAKPLVLLEIGASAGLLLFWDNYSYDYKNLGQRGISASPVHLDCELRGSVQAPIPTVFPKVLERIGLEYHPIDIQDENETRWLEALIWPEHEDRQVLLKAALEIAQHEAPKIIGGNGAETLPLALENLPDDATVCIFHSYTFAQMPRDIQEKIHASLLEFSQKRPCYRVSQEWLNGWDKPRIELFTYVQGEEQSELLAYAESHGRWLEWLNEV